MRHLLLIVIFAFGLAACETTVVSTTEGDPITMEGSFLLEGENHLSADNPTPLSDYADHIGQEVSEIKSVHPKNINVEVTDFVADSLLFESMSLKVAAQDLDTLEMASIDTMKQGVNKHKMNLSAKTELLPYFKAGQFTWIMECRLEEDYEETLPLKITMNFDITHPAG